MAQTLSIGKCANLNFPPFGAYFSSIWSGRVSAQTDVLYLLREILSAPIIPLPILLAGLNDGSGAVIHDKRPAIRHEIVRCYSPVPA